MRFGDAVRRAVLAIIQEKKLPQSVWHKNHIHFNVASTFWTAFLLSVSILAAPLLWLLFQPILYFMSMSITSPVERWLWFFLLVGFVCVVNCFSDFIEKADRNSNVSYGDLNFGEIVIYRMVSVVVFKWMFISGVRTVVNRFFSGLLAIWYVFFCAFLAGMF
ncbi:hypothetical protein ACJJH9_08470 [Microbulbifer sp. DLAB2-AF]|uniref:hypothetical protein n=1 Tax=unclassified Microbulbifer TaxID=2619833 RepID=UPI004039B60F